MTRKDRWVPPFWGRREFLGLLAASALAGKARAAVKPRIAAIDWAMLDTSVALGIMPVAATELIQFRVGAVEPEIPESVADLGLRGAPNFELLQLTRPDLILISPSTRATPAGWKRLRRSSRCPFTCRASRLSKRRSQRSRPLAKSLAELKRRTGF